MHSWLWLVAPNHRFSTSSFSSLPKGYVSDRIDPRSSMHAAQAWYLNHPIINGKYGLLNLFMTESGFATCFSHRTYLLVLTATCGVKNTSHFLGAILKKKKGGGGDVIV